MDLILLSLACAFFGLSLAMIRLLEHL